MVIFRLITGVVAVLMSALFVGPLRAQTSPAGGHVHYAEPAAQQASPSGALAPRLQNLGSHTFPVSTRNRQAQQFMNQGLNLAYAFNHAEARRAFREAARLDLNLAVAYYPLLPSELIQRRVIETDRIVRCPP